MVQQLLSQIASVKKDMVILEKSEFTMIRNETEVGCITVKSLLKIWRVWIDILCIL